MTYFKFLTASLILIVSATNVIFAQVQDEDPRCSQENSIALVSQLVEEGRSVAEPAKRIKILARSAEFIWKYDEPAARRYFTDAYKVAVDNFKEKGFETRNLRRRSVC